MISEAAILDLEVGVGEKHLTIWVGNPTFRVPFGWTANWELWKNPSSNFRRNNIVFWGTEAEQEGLGLAG